ncbi:unnamed protein product [Urochloa decumbens]|uniref:Uncharacterized protein n=1 Tax=Urochloa decumbens TaxID=240449 RepID=A0ABC9CUA9_9POAL
MAEAAAGAAPAPASSDVTARLQQVVALLFPSNLAAKAALFALVMALVPLLPTSQAPRIWELPHLLLLGIIISYGVFGQKNADADVAAASAAADEAKPGDDVASVEAYVSQMMQASPLIFEDDGGGASSSKGGGVQAWSSQYLPDDPLVVVADADANNGGGDAGEKPKPLHLPVRKLKPAAAEDSATPALADDIFNDDGIEEEEEEEELLAPKSGGYEYGGVRERAIPSPSSVLDADLTLSPTSPPLLPPPPPPPPPFLTRSLRKAKARSFNGFGAIGDRSTNGRPGLHGVYGSQFRSKSAVQATRSAFAGGYDPVVPVDDDDEAFDAELLDDDEAVAASEGSFSSDGRLVTDGEEYYEEDVFEEEAVEEEEDGSSCDEELFELASKPGLEEDVEEEVDRKADEFIAKFREQIRMQRVEPPTRR